MTRTIEILDRLIGFDTVSSNSNLNLIAYVEDLLRGLGCKVTRCSDETSQKAGLFAVIGPGDGGVLLAAHSDVVPVAGQDWSHDPFRLTEVGDRLFGRGSTDMKGFLASALAATEAAATRPLKEPLKLSISYDEEVGCLGMADMVGALPNALGSPRAAIVGEPTNMAVATGHKGKASLTATFRGQAGHSALAPRFVNALHLAADFVAELRRLQDWLAEAGARDDAYAIPYSTIHAGCLSGGTALNIVPDRAELAFEFRHLADDSPDMLRDRIDAAAEIVAAPYRATCPAARIDIRQTAAYPGLETGTDAAVVRQVREFTQGTDTTKVAFGTEAGFLSGIGIPTVVCGPGSMDDQGHKPDEFILKSELAACDAMLGRLVDTLCRGAVR